MRRSFTLILHFWISSSFANSVTHLLYTVRRSTMLSLQSYLSLSIPKTSTNIFLRWVIFVSFCAKLLSNSFQWFVVRLISVSPFSCTIFCKIGSKQVNYIFLSCTWLPLLSCIIPSFTSLFQVYWISKRNERSGRSYHVLDIQWGFYLCYVIFSTASSVAFDVLYQASEVKEKKKRTRNHKYLLSLTWPAAKKIKINK